MSVYWLKINLEKNDPSYNQIPTYLAIIFLITNAKSSRI